MSTTLACASCRRSKMKCVGFDSPPCVRCAKVGRECVPQQYTRNRPGLRSVEKTLASPAPKSASHTINEIPTPHPNPWSPNEPASRPREESRDWPPNDHNLPSIYATPPLVSIIEETTPSDSTYSYSSSVKRRRIEVPPLEDPLTHRDMVRLIEFAARRLLDYNPILSPEEIRDPQKVIEQKRNLANCICFVAARFLPGGRAMREKLLPTISKLLNSKFAVSRGGDEDELATLQALMVLYVHRPATTTTQFEDVTHWRLKTIVEAYAVHLGCHRSINELRNLIRSGAPNITLSKSYKMYVMWLWLFTMSQHVSLVIGSPPSISEDATIRLAPDTLKHLHKSQSATRLLGEVELCLLWSKASMRDRGLAEWWCPAPVDMTDIETSIAVLNDVDMLLETWSSKWLPWIANDPKGRILEFHLYFAKFCMSTYSTRSFNLFDPQLSEQQQVLVRRSVAAAIEFIRLVTELDPVTKDEKVRYLADFGFVMISFCCQFIIRACEAFGSGMPDITENLATVEEAAQLMKEVAIDSSHSPALYGSLIGRALEKFRTAIDPVDESLHTPNTTLSLPDNWGNELLMMDPLWEFSTFLGDPSFNHGI